MNLVETIVTNKRFYDTCKSIVFFTMARNIPSTRKKKRRKLNTRALA
jgi:hypothetical protein